MSAIAALIKNRNYVFYWLASMCSEFGSMTLQFIISLYVFDLTGDAVLFGTLLFIAIVPRLIFYPLAGMWADRYDRRLLLLIPIGLAALVLFGFTAIELFVMPLGIASLFILVIVLEIFNIVFMSANMSIPPMIVTRDQLGAANSLGILYSDFGYIIGMVSGAVVYGLLGFSWSLLATSLSFVIGFVFIIPLRLVQPQGAQTNDSGNIPNSTVIHEPAPQIKSVRAFFQEVTLGARLVAKDRLLLVMFILSPAFNFFCVPIWDVVLLFFARGDLGLEPIPYGIFSSVQAVGDLIIALVVATLYTDDRALRFLRLVPLTFAASIAIMLLAGFMVSSTPLIAVLIVTGLGSAFMAMMATIFVICKNTLVQKRVANENLSRVFSVNRVTALIALPFGNLAFGFFVEYLGYQGSLAISIVAVLALFILTTRALPKL